MANALKWSALGTRTLIINGDATTPTLKNLTSTSRKLGNEIDNASVQNQYAEWYADLRFASAPAAGAVVEVYFIEAHDDTNYEDGDDSTTPAKPPAFLIPVRAVTTQQKIVIPYILLPPFKFKPLVINTAGQALTNTDNENRLYYRTYNDELQ